MLFNSYVFIFVFLPLTFTVYFILNKLRYTRIAVTSLVIASLVFYSYWNIAYLPLILLSLLFNFFVGRILSRDDLTSFLFRGILLFGITANLSLLGYFKYIDFFILNINYVADLNIAYKNVLLPLAISFFTFQQIAYLVDSSHKNCKEYSFLNYALFVTFFPQLIAGPIVHHKEMMPQFGRLGNKVISYKNIAAGIVIFVIGLFKKVVIADTFAFWATNGFDNPVDLNVLAAWATSLSYTCQLYFDFSGYADMAIGAALLFNIRLPQNFNSPYKAMNIQDFWRRWHMTLSRFLRNYIYIPLGGSRVKESRIYVNILITFLLAGIWHGAGYNFIFWGILHGFGLCIFRVWSRVGFKLPSVLAWFITFNFVNIGWIFFRALTWDDAIRVLSAMFSLKHIVLPDIFEIIPINWDRYGVAFGSFGAIIGQKHDDLPLWLLAGLLTVLLFRNSQQWVDGFKPQKRSILVVTGMFVYTLYSMITVQSEFLYFNF